MNLKRLSRSISRIIEHPKVLTGKFRGIYTCHSSSCFTVKDLLGKPVKTIIDVGANEGLFIAASKYVFPNSKIYAFEPIKEFYDKIKKIKNVTAFNFGLWDSDGKDILYQNKDNRGASSFLKPTNQYYKDIGPKKNIFETTALRKRFDKLNLSLERPCFLKLDVEGAEDRVLKGFGKRLHEIDILQIEWFFKDFQKEQMKLSKVISLLEKYGFNGFIQKEFGYINNSPGACDLIFFKIPTKDL